MSFLNPLLLFGLAAVAVPIIIHLLNRRKFRKIDWAAMKFVKLSIDQNQRRMKLEDLILLLLRCALLALLALALARPVMRQSESSFMGQAGVVSSIVALTAPSWQSTCLTIPKVTRSRPNSGSMTVPRRSRICSLDTAMLKKGLQAGGRVRTANTSRGDESPQAIKMQ